MPKPSAPTLPLAPVRYPELGPVLSSGTLRGKLVLVRVDYNLPPGLPTPAVAAHPRVRASVATVQALLAAGARPVLLTHRGRPPGRVVPELTCEDLVAGVSSALACPVRWAPDCVGRPAEMAAAALPPGEVLLLENTRFHAEEPAGGQRFVAAMAAVLGPDWPETGVFVHEAFASIHRAHASLSGLAAALPTSVLGLGMAAELAALGRLELAPARPLCVVVGGSTPGAKLALMESLIRRADVVMLAGGIGQIFLAARDQLFGTSHLDTAALEHARHVLAEAGVLGCRLLLPQDVQSPVENEILTTPVGQLVPGQALLDIGPATLATWQRVLHQAHSVLWLGSVGQFENPAFAHGTAGLAQALFTSPAAHHGGAIVGGDGLLHALATLPGLPPPPAWVHRSAAGMALLEAITGKSLPTLAILAARAAGRTRLRA